MDAKDFIDMGDKAIVIMLLLNEDLAALQAKGQEDIIVGDFYDMAKDKVDKMYSEYKHKDALKGIIVQGIHQWYKEKLSAK